MPIVNNNNKADVKSAYVVPPAAAAAAGAKPAAGGGGSVLKVGERFPLSGVSSVSVGLGWDVARKGSVDLDASCVLFDGAGQYVTSVYFGNLSTASCAALQHKVCVVHSGDNRTGAGEGDDETIAVGLDAIPANVRALFFCVNSYNGDPLAFVQSTTLRLYNTSKGPGVAPSVIGTFRLDDVAGGGFSTALLMAKLYRAEAGSRDWVLHVLGSACEGRSFGDLLPLMQQQLKDVIPNVVVNAKPNVLVLAKGENVSLNGNLKSLMCGLGWDQMGDKPIDLDASCVLFDAAHNPVDAVFFNRLTNANGSVRHGGDNLTGAGEGDDEKVFLELDRLPANVASLYILVNSYTGEPFSWIKNAYVRVVDTSSNTELVRFQLNGTGSPDDTALLMVKISRAPELVAAAAADFKQLSAAAPAPAAGAASGRWMLKALGHGTAGRMYKDNIKDCQADLRHELKVAANTGFQYTPLAAGAGNHVLAANGNNDGPAPERCCNIL